MPITNTEVIIVGPVMPDENGGHNFRVIFPSGGVRKYQVGKGEEFADAARDYLIKFLVDSGRLAAESKDPDEMKSLVRGAVIWDEISHQPPEALRGSRE